ncbi:PPE family protein [Halopolyspora algeriensis]|uniref:PPE family protein n=1 Tax=Halopolyspora algeriensis TaxID=1500506 RepID=A0A368VJY6_9ACTN|nr:PPE domain-containing protein [Halopolyspora algeriensis]RCW39968.1 PPE family protein [Halopolyspora algeriensis]TQM46595.1 PPE family protein [Halopolyspora algeriensis]
MGWGLDYIQEVGGAVVDGVQSAASATVEGFQDAASWVHDQLTPDIRPEGVNGHRIYVWFHHGPGTGSLDDAVDGWHRVSDKHTEVGDAVNSAMGKLHTSWDGEAATAAQHAARPLRDAADTASACAKQAGAALEAQSFGFNEAKKNITDVPADPPTMNPLAGGMGAVDHYREVQSYTAEQQANQAALQSYGSQTGNNSGSVPCFDGTSGEANRNVTTTQPESAGPAGAHRTNPGGAGTASTYSAGSGASDRNTSGSRGDGHTGGGVRTGAPGYPGGGSGSGAPSGTGSAWYGDDGGQPGGGGFEFGTSHDLSGAGMVAGAAGLAAGGGAVLGGGVLGERVGGRGGISGRGLLGTGSGTGKGTGSGPGGSTGRGGSGAPGVGGRSGVAPTTGSAGTTASSGAARTAAGAPMAAGTGARGQESDDEQHERPEWLTAEESPDELFGTDERTAPPVLGALPSEREGPQ